MTAKKADRRIQRTQTALRDALISLILKQDYEAITIKDIIDEANIGRSTFYAHYSSKEDLLRSGFKHLQEHLAEYQKEALAKRGDPKECALSFSLAMFEHAGEHKDIYRALVGGHGKTVVVNRIRDMISDLLQDELYLGLDQKTVNEIPRDIVIQYIAGAFMAVLTWWLDRGAKLPPEQIDATFRRLTLEGVMLPEP